MNRKTVPLDALRAEHATWMAALSRAAEGWVHARVQGAPTDEFDARMNEAERHTRRLERRIRRRAT